MKQRIQIPVFVNDANARWYVPCYFPDDRGLPEPGPGDRLVVVTAEIDFPAVEEVPGVEAGTSAAHLQPPPRPQQAPRPPLEPL